MPTEVLAVVLTNIYINAPLDHINIPAAFNKDSNFTTRLLFKRDLQTSCIELPFELTMPSGQ